MARANNDGTDVPEVYLNVNDVAAIDKHFNRDRDGVARTPDASEEVIGMLSASASRYKQDRTRAEEPSTVADQRQTNLWQQTTEIGRQARQEAGEVRQESPEKVRQL